MSPATTSAEQIQLPLWQIFFVYQKLIVFTVLSKKSLYGDIDLCVLMCVASRYTCTVEKPFNPFKQVVSNLPNQCLTVIYIEHELWTAALYMQTKNTKNL